jgi:eukaryotic-like serine/threonine-protein kinase
MADLPSPSQRVRFGEFELDRWSGELWRHGTCVVLPNQPFRILSVLIDRRGTVVTREEFRRSLWPEDTFVDFEHSLTAGVRRLRDALGDSALTPHYVETIPQRGYRFIASVEERDAAPPRRRPVAWVGALVALISILFAFSRLPARDSEAGSVDKPTLIRLTSTSGLNTDPALSRDGSLLAYASDRAGNADFDVYVQSVTGGDPIRLTKDPADEAEPSFSPDGSQVVFSRRDAGLYVVGSLGGEPRLIVRASWARTPRFSSDGRWIAYWTGFPASVVAGGIPAAMGSIFIVSSDGGSPRAVATPLASARYPVWSADGERLLFLGEENVDRKTDEWYVVSKNGGNATKTGAVSALRAGGLRSPFPIPGAWMARENMVVFATNEVDSSSVWEIPVSPSTGHVTGPPRPLTFGTASERGPVVSDDGRIAFASILENVDVWRVPLDANTGVVRGDLQRLTNGPASDRLISISSDGRSLSFISSRTGRDEVWIKDLQTWQERRVTHAGVEQASASPDGARMAFSSEAFGKRRIEILETADGLPSNVCDGCDDPGGWSRDGKRMMYATGPPCRLLVYDLPSGRRTEIVSHPTWSLQRPRFSPDGEWVAFHTANSPNVRQIYAVRSDPGGPADEKRWIPIVTDHGCHPSWSPDGALVYHFSFRDGAFCPWVQRIDQARRPIGAPRPVLHLHHPRLRAASGAAAFNDVVAGYLYLTLTEATGNIWILDPRPTRR